VGPLRRRPVLFAVTATILLGWGTTALLGGGGDPKPAGSNEPASPLAAPAGYAPEPSAEGAESAVLPDLTGEDGQVAVDKLENLGMLVSLSEDDGRDPTGCTVEGQDQFGEIEAGTEVVLTLDCRQIDWDNQEGEDWDLFNQAYSTGWDDGCDEAFFNSPSGSLYYDSEEFTSLDCELNNPGDASGADIPIDVPDDPQSAGEDLGMTDGCMSAFDDLSLDGSLYYGDEAFDSSFCP
jgi:hypothetical protein